MSIDGVLPIWKPAGMTSHDVVAKARRILGMKRIGHTGTLDPMVTGVLPLCLGKATRLVEYIQELPKEYEAKLVIGLATDTEDLTGEVTERFQGPVILEQELVVRTINGFVGTIEQVPPMYSAVKVEGKRLYELARSGQTVERKPRKAVIHSIHILSINLDLPQPEITFRVLCSKGTYIRTLCADIGRALGFPAVMGELVRTGTGGMNHGQCATLEELVEAKNRGEDKLVEYLLKPDEAIPFFPAVHVDERHQTAALQGKRLQLKQGMIEAGEPGVSLPEGMVALVRLYGPGEQFLGLFRRLEDGLVLAPEKVFVPET